jgi:hypothetical protein
MRPEGSHYPRTGTDCDKSSGQRTGPNPHRVVSPHQGCSPGGPRGCPKAILATSFPAPTFAGYVPFEQARLPAQMAGNRVVCATRPGVYPNLYLATRNPSRYSEPYPLPTRQFVCETLSNNASQGHCRPLCIVDTKPYAVVVSKIELRHVTT